MKAKIVKVVFDSPELLDAMEAFATEQGLKWNRRNEDKIRRGGQRRLDAKIDDGIIITILRGRVNYVDGKYHCQTEDGDIVPYRYREARYLLHSWGLGGLISRAFQLIKAA